MFLCCTSLSVSQGCPAPVLSVAANGNLFSDRSWPHILKAFYRTPLFLRRVIFYAYGVGFLVSSFCLCLCLLCLPRCAWTVWLEWELASPRSRTNPFPSQWCACGVTAAAGWLRPFTWLSRGHTPPQAPLLLIESSPACLCAVSCYQGSFSSRHRQYCCHSLG